ncbi:putative pentatricopeptide repeat-containing protein At1g26500 [Rhodamnia argentea]|uniref:Pentatricopeptide repeat-containing protein At1g26500 n=1 Tax=Rhodamnia argentea TaxID=178133 RepID=A0A8B8MXA7_9MYRT|nr:putative pentatricopeptide repeat-containing protein At1g26500 [Rhodamnia argentea]
MRAALAELPKPLTSVLFHLRPLSSTTAVDPSHLLRVSTILYQQQHSPDSRLHASLRSFPFHLSPEFFLRVCNNFPLSWRPVHRFYQFTLTRPDFPHSSLTLNKLADVVGKSRNVALFWEVLQDMARRRLANEKTFKIALKTLAQVRELKKCVGFFHLMNENGWGYSVETLNMVVECLCRDRLVEEAKYVVFQLKDVVRPNGVTYGWLIRGFCNAGDLIEASKVWNSMVDEGLEPEVWAFEAMMERFFKSNRYGEAMKLLGMMRMRMQDRLDVSTYRLVISWLCRRGRVSEAYMVFEEMHKRGIQTDALTAGSLVYGLLAQGRVGEAYKIVEGIERPDINVYHGLIKGLLKLKRAGEATDVFREMIRRGCEPIMHTYIMLLQGHLGKRGRKGPDTPANFDSIFVGGLVKAGKSLEATKYVERTLNRGLEVPRFDYNKFLHYYSSEDGTLMFEEASKRLREAGMIDLADILERYGEKMATRERRRNRAAES